MIPPIVVKFIISLVCADLKQLLKKIRTWTSTTAPAEETVRTPSRLIYSFSTHNIVAFAAAATKILVNPKKKNLH